MKNGAGTMRNVMNSAKSGQHDYQKTKWKLPKARTLIFAFEISMILGLLVFWLSTPSIQQSKNLYVLFFYSFPSEFLVGLVPHEPVLLFFGNYYPPLTVALVSVVSTVLTEALNYSMFKYVADTTLFKKFSKGRSVRQVIALFKKMPFTAIWVAGFTPIPFYPFRFLVVMGHYPVWKYLFAVFLSRGPRFFILAQIGYTFNIPGVALAALFILLIISFNVPIFMSFMKNKSVNALED